MNRSKSTLCKHSNIQQYGIYLGKKVLKKHKTQKVKVGPVKIFSLLKFGRDCSHEVLTQDGI